MKNLINTKINESFERVDTSVGSGLTTGQVSARRRVGAANTLPNGLTPSVGHILRKNVLTLFNLLNAVLALLLIFAGTPKNALFVGLAIAGTVMGAIQELRAKRTLDKLSILGQGQAVVVRDGIEAAVNPDEIVLDDIICVSAGDQIYADAVIVESDGLEADESLLTGESNNVQKRAGDALLSGSFITSGTARARVAAVGTENFAIALTIEAKKERSKKSQLIRMLNAIIRVLSIVIVPVGALLFYTEIGSGIGTSGAIIGASTAIVGMLPMGLIVLTGVTLTVGAVSLSSHGALVQSLYSIETLARSDVLCLDKTGTMTDGALIFEKLVPQKGFAEEEARLALTRLMGALRDDNATASALSAVFTASGGEDVAPATVRVPFSSTRKWSGAYFEDGKSIILGAPGFVFSGQDLPFAETVGRFTVEGYRVLCLACSSECLGEDGRLPDNLCCMALIILSDAIRADAPETFNFFVEQGMTIKVISGDDPRAASVIAAKAGVPGADRVVDMSSFADGSALYKTVEEYTVFGRVSPHQKRELVRALQQNGHVVCMTGDGVNDVPAMKEADCGVAMAGGSGAARSVCDFVLMSSDFSTMVYVLNEGRRVINNIEKVAALYLVRTIYSVLLACLYIFLPFHYPFSNLQMTPVNTLIVGIPTFFLALRPDTRKPGGKFIDGVLETSLPAALTVATLLLSVQVIEIRLGLTTEAASTISVFLIGAVGFTVLFKISRPANTFIWAMLGVLVAVYFALFTFADFAREFFTLVNLLSLESYVYLTLLIAAPLLFWFFSRCIRAIRGRLRM